MCILLGHFVPKPHSVQFMQPSDSLEGFQTHWWKLHLYLHHIFCALDQKQPPWKP